MQRVPSFEINGLLLKLLFQMNFHPLSLSVFLRIIWTKGILLRFNIIDNPLDDVFKITIVVGSVNTKAMECHIDLWCELKSVPHIISHVNDVGNVSSGDSIPGMHNPFFSNCGHKDELGLIFDPLFYEGLLLKLSRVSFLLMNKTPFFIFV